MFVKFRRLIAENSGATAIEYGLICAGIAVAIMLVGIGGALGKVISGYLHRG